MSKVDVLEALAGLCNEHGIGKVEYDRRSGIYDAVAELIADANRWRAVTPVYAGFQTRGDQMLAYISTPQWLGDWSDFNDAIDRHFEINDADLASIGSTK